MYSSVPKTVAISTRLFTEMPFYDITLSKLQNCIVVLTCNSYFALTLKDFTIKMYLFRTFTEKMAATTLTLKLTLFTGLFSLFYMAGGMWKSP